MIDPNTEALQELTIFIRDQESKILQSLKMERRFGVMELARSMDYFVIREMTVGRKKPDKDEERTSSIIPFGFSKALMLFIDTSCNNEGAPLFDSSPELERWANSVLLNCGYLGYCDQLIDTCKIGLAELIKTADNKYRYLVTAANAGTELAERQNFTWYQELTRSTQRGKARAQAKRRSRIQREMSRRVMPWMTHYIQYETSPEIDRFYKAEGKLLASRMFGHDAFPPDAKFGPYEFRLYCDAVATLVGWAAKHFEFTVQLLAKYPDLRSRNVATITATLDKLSAEMAAALNIDVAAAEHLLNCLTLTPENKEVHCTVSGNLVSPPLIKIGERRVIFPVWGNILYPFAFMLNELRRRFRNDWFTRVNERERSFREEIYALFSSERFIKVESNVRLKAGGTEITDIDALLFDNATGEVGIFQLKWQDLFAGSMRERESRKLNILKTGNQWIERVTDWLSSKSFEEVAKAFRLKGQTPITAIRLFMLGRNFALFSGEGTPDQRAAWGMWYQFLRLARETENSTNPIQDLYNNLKRESPFTKAKPKMKAERLCIAQVEIEFDAL